MKIDIIPKGKENRKSKRVLMCKAGIVLDTKFQDEMARLKKKHIILFDDGYYRPKTKEEYEEFIKKCSTRKDEVLWLIELAKKEMEEI